MQSFRGCGSSSRLGLICFEMVAVLTERAEGGNLFMKKIEAIIRRERLGTVRRALASVGYPGLTVYEVRGHGQQKGRIWADDGILEFLPKMKLDTVVRDADVEKVLNSIIGAGRTGNIGDGKIFISSIEEVIRLRTGERGDGAL